MRYCLNCSRMTLGEPRFCTFCGRTYEAKLCPRLHVNPREAQVCSECGSRDLTTPAPKPPFWLYPVLLLFSMLSGFVLLSLSLGYLVTYFYVLFARPALLLPFMLLGLVLGGLWLLYVGMPGIVRAKLQKRIRKASRDV
jgi:RNA polymerase subunit RPABC4/transcription elongation factor Spt4